MYIRIDLKLMGVAARLNISDEMKRAVFESFESQIFLLKKNLTRLSALK